MEYDVSGPEGNAFVILGRARKWAKEVWGDKWEEKWKVIRKEATAGDYYNLLKTIEEAFNGSVKFVGR